MIRIFSPDAQNHPVRLIEQKLGLPPNTAIVVPYEAMDGARAQYCFQNVRDVVAKIGGQIVNGWLVWQHENIFVEADVWLFAYHLNSAMWACAHHRCGSR
jgi:hypothetical protein